MQKTNDGHHLLYKVRGDGHPQGKPRIYFTCHPDDAPLYFDEIASDLLKRVNCAVWYKSDPAFCFADEEEMAEWLGQMQLFVMPVTTRLLSSPNGAMDQEYAFAIAHHIPILPLMEEERIDDLFARRFGDIQYLAPKRIDPTAISFDEKINKFLKKTLIGDEMAQTIRAAFDAYIFLSYRKKDRRQALQLMRLIHQNALCESFAIWYDEYLVPNENFNTAIQEALTRSQLFALVVTPNLVNEPNYVMQVEYPAARLAGKQIFPVETQETDRQALEKYYDGIPACIPAQNEREFSDSLLACLKRMALTEKNVDPEHRFFIGLAYLDGIDVEVDHARAFRLIEGAANQGLAEAMEQMAVMYAEGKGVSRDEEISLAWRLKLVETLKSGNDMSRLCDAMTAYAEACCNMGRYIQAGRMMKELLNIAGALPSDFPGRNLMLASGYDFSAICANQLGYYDDADDMNLQSAQLRYGENLENAIWDDETFPYLYHHFLHFAARCVRKGQHEKAIAYYGYARMVAFDLYQKKSIRMDDWESRSAYLFVQLGTAELQQKEYEKARDSIQQGLQIYSRLAIENPIPALRRHEMLCHGLLGDLERGIHQFQAARAHYDESLRLAWGIFDETGSIQAQNDMANLYRALAEIEIATGHLHRARQWTDHYQKDMERIWQKVDSKSCTEDYARCFLLHAKISMAEGNLSEAQILLAKANEILAPLHQRLPQDPATGGLMATIAYSHGDILLKEGSLEKAQAFYHQAIEWMQKTADESNEFAWRKSDEAAIWERMGVIARQKDDIAQAKAHWNKALLLREELARVSSAPDALEGLWTLRQYLGDIAYDQNDYGQARQYYSDGLQVAIAIMHQTDNPLEKKAFIVMNERMGNVERAAGNMDAASRHYIAMRNTCQEMMDATEGIEAMADLCKSHKRIGELACAQGQLETAKMAFEAMRETALSMQHHFGAAKETRNMLSLADSLLGAVLSDLGEAETAESYLKESIHLREEMMRSSQTMDDSCFLLDAYITLIRHLSAMGKMEEANRLCAPLLALAQQMHEKYTSLPMRSGWHRALLISAAVARELNDPKRALALNHQAIAILESLLSDIRHNDLLSALALANHACAEIKREQNISWQANYYLKKAAQWADEVKTDSLDCDSQLSVAQLFMDYGAYLDERKKTGQADLYYSRAHKIAQYWMEQSGLSSDLGWMVIQCDAIQGGRAMDQGRYDTARALYQQGHNICIQLMENAQTSEDREELQAMMAFFQKQCRKIQK